LSQQPVHHNGMWWSRDSSGLISFYDDRESAWKPWDPKATQVSPPVEWAQGQPVAYPSAPPQYGGGYPQQPVYVVQNSTNGMAIASLVLGILWLWWLGSILALIFGYVGKSQIERSGGQQSGRGMAIAGIVLGWIGVAILVLFIVLVVAVSPQAGV
jgi:hypothetical protein